MRRILWIAGLVVVFLAMLAMLIPAVVDVNKYKPQIEQQLAKAGGKTVRLGPITLSVLPPVTLRISDVVVRDPESTDEEPLLQAPSMALRIDPWAYFQGRTVVTSLRLDRPRITLRQSAPGFVKVGRSPAGSSAPEAGSPTKVSDIYLNDLSLIVLDDIAPRETPLFNLENVDVVIPEFDPSQMENPFLIKATVNMAGATLSTRLIPEPLKFDSGTGEAGNNQFDLHDIKASIQGTSLDGRISAAPLDKPAITFQLHSQEVDLRKLQSWLKAGGPASVTEGTSKNRNLPATKSDFRLKLAGTITSDRTWLANKVVENTTSKIRVDDSLLVIEEFKGRFYSGTLDSSGQVSFSSDRPGYQFRSVLRGVNLAKLLEEKGKPERLTGLLDLDAQFTGLGLPQRSDDPLSSLRGSGKFAIYQGSLKTLNLLEKLKFLSIIPFLKVVEGPMTSFASLKSDFRISGRKIETDRMRLDTGVLKLVLSGHCTLDEDMDYIVRVEELAEQQPGSLVGSILGMVARNINVEFRLTGTLSHPEVAAYRR